MKTSRITLLGFASLLTLGGCGGLGPDIIDPKRHNIIDPNLGHTRQDYRDILNPEASKKSATGVEEPPIPEMLDGYTTTITGAAEPPIPDIAPILATPQPPKLGETKLVSIAVTDDVPLKDVLLELARLADIDVEVDAGITGGIAFRAKERPFNEVIERIASLAELRYTMKNNVLRIERDAPYVETYALDFLNAQRASTNTISISTSVLSSGASSGGGDSGGSTSSSSSSGGSSGGDSGGGLTTGSQTSISMSTENDFWEKLEDGIKQILAYAPERRVSETNIAMPQPGAPAAAAASAADAPPGAGTAASAPPAAAAAAPAASTEGATGSAPSNYTINRQAGVLTIAATDRQHNLIKEYLHRLEQSASAQVLIEAKIVEVTLNDEFASGVDWTLLSGRNGNFSFNPQFSIPSTDTSGTNLGTINFGQTFPGLNLDLSAAVDLTERFGTTRTLSSPRLHAINNQQAVLTFARNEVYFEVEISKEEQSSTGTSPQEDTLTVNSNIKTVPIGIILTMLPSVNLDTNEVTLNVRPTLSRVVDRVEDPGLSLAVALDPAFSNLNIKNLIPVVEVRELDSILKLRSGQVMVIGGLMEEIATNEDKGIPGASEVPIVGNLFKSIGRDNQTKELVIFIRATILDSRGNAHDADKALYHKFTRDPRPLAF